MDKTAQDPNVQDQNLPKAQNQTQPQQVDSTTPVIQPVSSSINKEREIASVDYIKPSEPEIKIPIEVSQAGVEKVSEAPKLDQIHEQIGVKNAAETVPAPTKPTGAVKIPMTEDEAKTEISKDKVGLNLNIQEHGREDAYILPSRFFLATIVLKVINRVKSIGKK